VAFANYKESFEVILP